MRPSGSFPSWWAGARPEAGPRVRAGDSVPEVGEAAIPIPRRVEEVDAAWMTRCLLASDLPEGGRVRSLHREPLGEGLRGGGGRRQVNGGERGGRGVRAGSGAGGVRAGSGAGAVTAPASSA